jgi:hypothetical protein
MTLTPITLLEEDVKHVKYFLHKFFWDSDDLQLVAIYNVIF